MSKIVLGIDLDGTLADLHGVWISRYNKSHSPKLTREGWKDFFHYDLTLPDTHRPDMEKVLGMLHPDMYETTKPFPGARDVVIELSKRNDVILKVVTANPHHDERGFEEMKTKWLEKHIPELSKGVIFARDKSGKGLDVLIDDAPHNLVDAEYTPVVIDRPWNRHLNFPHRFKDWSEAKDVIHSALNHAGQQKSANNKIGPLKSPSFIESADRMPQKTI